MKKLSEQFKSTSIVQVDFEREELTTFISLPSRNFAWKSQALGLLDLLGQYFSIKIDTHAVHTIPTMEEL